MSESELRLERLSWPTIGRLVADGWDRVILPVGATEQHGPHMSLDIDSLHTWAVAQHVARRLGHTLVAPLLPIGCSDHHMGFPGTMTLERSTFEALLRDACSSLARHGFRCLLLMSGHGGNHEPLAAVAPALQDAVSGFGAHIVVYGDAMDFMSALVELAAREGVSAGAAGWHAGEFETSLILDLDPEAVDMERAERGNLSEDPAVLGRLATEGTRAVSPNGVLGDPTVADPERGARYMHGYVEHVEGFFAARLASIERGGDETGSTEEVEGV